MSVRDVSSFQDSWTPVMNRTRLFSPALMLATLGWAATPARAHDGFGQHTHEAPAAKASREMGAAARNLRATLTPEQKQKISFGFNDPLRYDWHFIPRPR